jgi:hypothetical protein
MSNLQGAGGVNQGSPNTTQTNDPQFTGAPNLQPSGDSDVAQQNFQELLNTNNVLSSQSSGQVLSVTTSTGSNQTTIQPAGTDVTLTPQTEFVLPSWVMIVAGIVVVLAGISFIWSQRNDMQRTR